MQIYALKLLGVKYLYAMHLSSPLEVYSPPPIVRLTFSACGSLQEHAAPQHIVLADQFIDRTKVRPDSFFGEGCVEL